MSCTKKIKIGDTVYTANVDFRTAIECNRIANDPTIGDFERALGIICTMFGGQALDNPDHYEKLLSWTTKYLTNGRQVSNEKPDMDYIQDMDYIEASFMSDYRIDLENTEMEWHKFYKLMNGLSNSELGDCCILNRIRNLRNFDVSQIKDPKEKHKILEAKQQVALREQEKPVNLTEEQQKSVDEFYEKLGY